MAVPRVRRLLLSNTGLPPEEAAKGHRTRSRSGTLQPRSFGPVPRRPSRKALQHSSQDAAEPDAAQALQGSTCAEGKPAEEQRLDPDAQDTAENGGEAAAAACAGKPAGQPGAAGGAAEGGGLAKQAAAAAAAAAAAPTQVVICLFRLLFAARLQMTRWCRSMPAERSSGLSIGVLQAKKSPAKGAARTAHRASPKGTAKRASPAKKACADLVRLGGLRSRRAPAVELASSFAAAKPVPAPKTGMRGLLPV